MNNLYFACANCKIYIDAGYRWAYWQLEDPGVVDRKNDVDVSAVLKREEYWNPPNDENSGWLYEEIFPPLREFFVHHNGHRIVFGTGEDLAPDMDDYDFEWMNIGYLAKPTVRYLYEVVGLRSWNELCEFMEASEYKPGWWCDTLSGNPMLREKAKRKFEELSRSSLNNTDPGTQAPPQN